MTVRACVRVVRCVLGCLAALLLLALPAPAAVVPEYVDVYVFWGRGCPHCERAISFIRRIEAEQPRLRVQYFEIWRDAANRGTFGAVVKRLSIDEPALPLTVIGDAVMTGYDSDDTSGAELRRRIEGCLANTCPDTIGDLIRGAPGTRHGMGSTSDAAPKRAVPAAVSVPLFGDIRTADLSLPVLTVVLAALDGFNPCAMWVLVFLIGLLLGMQDRFRMWVLGGAFIAGSALVYFLFMAAWLKLLMFMGAVAWVRTVVAVVALVGGIYHLREYWRNAEAVCTVTAPQARRRVFDSLRALAGESHFWLALAGILALAFAVNLVELLCSAGIPAVYTQVLALSHLPAWQYYGYLALYIFIFMLDDLFVFVVAMKTLQVTGVTSRYTRFSQLAGGIVLLVIGGLLLLRPDWLMFG